MNLYHVGMILGFIGTSRRTADFDWSWSDDYWYMVKNISRRGLRGGNNRTQFRGEVRSNRG